MDGLRNFNPHQMVGIKVKVGLVLDFVRQFNHIEFDVIKCLLTKVEF